MPSSPTKPQRSVLFKVTIPSRIENLYQSANDEEKCCSKPNKLYQDIKHPSKRTFIKTYKESENTGQNETNHELMKIDLRYKLQSMHKSGTVTKAVSQASTNVLDTLKNSSHGRVPYNRKHTLSEEELPPVNQLASVSNKAIDRISEQSPDLKLYRPKTRGRVPKANDVKPLDSILDRSLEDNFNKSLAEIESIELLNDSISLLKIEQKNKKAGADYIVQEKKKQDEFLKRSAQLSHESYEQWAEKSKAKIQQQVNNLKSRKSERDSTIESEYRKQQQYFQKKFEEDQAQIKRVEEEKEAEKQRQIKDSWNNISNCELRTLEIVAVAEKCVPDPKIDPEIEALLSMIGKQSKAVAGLKAAAVQLEKEGKLSLSAASNFEQECGSVYNQVIAAVKQLNSAINRVNKEQAAKMLAEEEARKKEEARAMKEKEFQARKEAAATIVQQAAAPSAPSTALQNSAANIQRQSSTDAIVSGNIISNSAFNEYQKLEKQLKELKEGIDKFVVDKNTDCMKMRSALKLITVTPINSISASSNEHMANKVKELVHILEGKETARGHKRINPGLNKLTLNYCFNIAASKFVDQACEQVAFSDNLVPAFSIAAVITGIWQKHSQFGDLFLAYLYQRCPYTVPAYWNKKSNETNEDYLRRLGYATDGDKLEDRDKYLLKMEGCIKLYAAIIQSPPSFSNLPHPHGLSHGWVWLSRMLNLEPVPDVTATALEAFLKVTGSALLRVYKSQFLKLLEFLYSHYLPKVEAVTLESNLGPITRLKLYLEKIQKTRSVPGPEGRISQSICH
ncbi:hypothetical protein ACHWQZ_G006269 [Mnemiopsis leidyi]